MLTTSEIKTYKRRQINDWVHTWTYLVRNPKVRAPGPYVLTGMLEFLPMGRPAHPVLTGFFAYMLRYPHSMERVGCLVRSITCTCPCVTEPEWQYAKYILDTYYAT